MRGLGATVRGEGGAVVVRAGVRVVEDVGLVGVFDDELFVDELFEEELVEEELVEEDVELLELLEVLRAAGSVVALPMRTPGTVSGAGALAWTQSRTDAAPTRRNPTTAAMTFMTPSLPAEHDGALRPA
ncbi:hypothetical protein EEW87_16865 [Janibacter melonis]|uniref:Uncharacterized protein n=1 Tax=Janibacter melonis TaxID=262209 RepID=A0A650GSM5_9MICO|nr:hypothetical protein [Janibacter melonis]MCB5991516.1 hypothetical protein [Janibacter melonis]QGX08550.1 hypothetical protein EEW87_16865 [Janibacter melonis]